MKCLFRRIVPALLLTLLMSSAGWAQGRIGTVDLRKIFDNYWKTKQADAALKDRAADLEKDHKTMLEEWKKAKDEYQTMLTAANDQTLSLEERDRRKKSAEDKLKQIKESEDTIAQYERQARSTIDEQRKRMRDTIVEEIRAAVESKARAAGYALVLDTVAESANNTPVVLYSNNENDMTKEVLAQLNAGAPPEAPKSDDNKADDKSSTKKDGAKKEKK